MTCAGGVMVGDGARALEELKGKGRIYAVLDGARDPRIARLVVGGSAPGSCLYRGKLPQGLADAAPQLLHLRPGHDYADIFFQVGWRKAWGILLASAAAQPLLYRHLRRFLRVRSEEGKFLVFRYYDPRILRRYLPSCTPGELAQFFGPISAIVVEAEEERQFHLFRRAPAGFEHLRVKDDAEAVPVQTWPAAETVPMKGPMLLRQAQMEALAEPLRVAFETEMLAYLRDSFPGKLRDTPEQQVRALIRDGIRRAFRYGINTAGSLASYIELMVAVAPDFDQKEEAAWLLPILEDPGMSGDEKATYVHQQLMPRAGG